MLFEVEKQGFDHGSFSSGRSGDQERRYGAIRSIGQCSGTKSATGNSVRHNKIRQTGMTRYYFDLFNGDGPVPDEQGQEVSSREGISREVSRILADIAREELPGRGKGAITIKVRDESGQPVFTGSLSFKTCWHDENDR